MAVPSIVPRALAVAAIALLPALSVRAATVVEYYHATFDHYFITSLADEIAKLDNGTIGGWTRTGKEFEAYNVGDGTWGMCRFFSTAFGARSSHFYTPFPSECNAVKANPSWQFEGEIFGARLPDTAARCPTGTTPLYRLYNNGKGGAPNHRYTTDAATRGAMLIEGWTPEGAGPFGVVACVPPNPAKGAEGVWLGVNSKNQNVAGLVLNSSFYFLYTDANSLNVAGLVQGSLAYGPGGAFTSSNAKDFNFSVGVTDASVSGTYFPRSTMNGVIAGGGASSAFALRYDPVFEQPANLDAAAAKYLGGAVTVQGLQAAQVTVTATGSITGTTERGCSFNGSMFAYEGTTAFNVQMKFDGGRCSLGTETLMGFGYYDPTYARIYVAAPNDSRTDGFAFMGNKQ